MSGKKDMWSPPTKLEALRLIGSIFEEYVKDAEARGSTLEEGDNS